jgi:hypothetical protein
MKSSNRFPRCRHKRTDAPRRAQFLAAFDRSGLSAAAFARRQGLNYTTFCGWRQRQAKAKPSPDFVRVEAPTPAAAAQLVIELGAGARIQINSADQIELAARLLQSLNLAAPC